MVVFTCNYCGDSVKKNAVEKHYSFKCRNRIPALTCVDCLKDFGGEEHVGHVSCVTEAERYAAKGFVAKPPSDKGKRKQECWVKFVQELSESNDIRDERIRDALQTISKLSGIPQKKPKFLNFCKNKFSPFIAEELWNILDKRRNELSKDQKENEAQSKNFNCQDSLEDRKRKRVDSVQDTSVDSSSSPDKEANNAAQTTGKKNKKHKNHKHATESQEGILESQTNGNATKTGKRHGKVLTNGVISHSINEHDGSDGAEQIISDSVIGEIQGNDQTSQLSKKEKKERRKKEKYEKQLLEIQHYQPSEVIESNTLPGKNEKPKKTKKHRAENGISENKAETVLKFDEKEQEKDLENGTEEKEGSGEEPVKPSTKFNWEETVVKILESKGELSLKRMEKKVVNEYLNSRSHPEPVEKAIAKFNNKILKMSRVKVRKDTVKLVS